MTDETRDWVIKMRQSLFEHQERMESDPVYAAEHNAQVARQRAALQKLLDLEDELGLGDD